jgi:hypothetical protein
VSPNPDSILDSVKKALGLDSEDTSFDLDVTMFINAVFGPLRQLGVGPDTGFVIVDNTTLWSQYVTSMTYLGMVKAYIFLKVKTLFDPPESRSALPAIEKMLEEYEWRINVQAEEESDAVTSSFIPKVVQLQYASTISIDASAGDMFYLELAGDCTMLAPVNGVDGKHITLEITSNGHSVSWRTGWDFGDVGTPVLSGAGKSDIVSAYYKTAVAKWRAGFATGF